MNDTVQAVLAWFGAITALGYVGFGLYLAVAGARWTDRAEAIQAAREATPDAFDLSAVDFDAELLALIEGDDK